MPGFTLNVNAARVAQLVIGGAAVYGGFKLSEAMVRSGYRDDLLGDPTRIVEIDGKTMIYQPRDPQGSKLTTVAIGGGMAAAVAGSVLVLGAAGGAGLGTMARVGLGTALFALGVGAIAGATAIDDQWRGTDFEPIR